MVNQIDEPKKENHRLKENGKKIGQIFIKSQKLNFKISKYADEENILMHVKEETLKSLYLYLK